MNKLKPIHYIGAGLAVLFLIGAVIAVPLILLGVSKARAVDTKAAEEQKRQESQRPAVVEMPKQVPPQAQASIEPPAAPASSPETPTLNAQQPSDLKPIDDDKPIDDKPVASKPTEKAAPVAQKPAQKPVAPKPAPKKPSAPKPDPRCALTGDC